MKKKISIDQLNEMLEEKSEFEMSDKFINQSTAVSGRVYGEVYREKMSAVKKGVPLTEQNKLNIGLALTSRKFSDDHKLNLQLAARGKPKAPQSEKHKMKIGAANRGKTHTQQTCMALSDLKKKPCTNDGITYYASRNDMVAVHGTGKKSYKHPNFRYVSREEYEAYLKGKK